MNIPPLLLLLGAHLIVPVSDQVPRLDVAVSCKATANLGIADSQTYDACMKDENEAREQLLQSWQSYPAPEQKRCAAMASEPGLASYVELLVCLQIARDAKAAETIRLKGARKK